MSFAETPDLLSIPVKNFRGVSPWWLQHVYCSICLVFLWCKWSLFLFVWLFVTLQECALQEFCQNNISLYLMQWDFFFNCRMTKNERRIVFWTKTVELVFSIFLDLPSTSPDAVVALYRNLSLLTLNTKKMFLLTTSCLLAMAGFISELAGSVPFFLASLRTRAGSLEGLCSPYCCVPETLLAEAFAEIKMSLKRRQTGKR